MYIDFAYSTACYQCADRSLATVLLILCMRLFETTEYRYFQMKKKDVSDHEDKCSKEHMRLLLKNVEDLKAQFRCRPSKSCKFMWSRKLERSR